MKKIFTFVFCLMLVINGFSQTVVEEFPWTEDFQGDISSWTLLDLDGDEHNWSNTLVQGSEYAHSGTRSLISESYDIINEEDGYCPDNWAISPLLRLPNDPIVGLSWYSKTVETQYPDYYYVLISENASLDPKDYTILYENVGDNGWKKHGIDLTRYAGKDVRIAFRHSNCGNRYAIAIDDVTVNSDLLPVIDAPILAATSENVTFKIIAPEGATVAWTFTDGNPQAAMGSEGTTKWNAAGVKTISVKVIYQGKTATASTTITVKNKLTLPFFDDFEDESTWNKYYLVTRKDATSRIWERSNNGPHSGTYCARHTIGDEYGVEEGYLTTSLIDLSNISGAVMTFYTRTGYPEDLHDSQILISTTDTRYESFTEVWREIPQLVSKEWRQESIDLTPYAGQKIYIQFRYWSNYEHIFYVDDLSIKEFEAYNLYINGVQVSDNNKNDLSTIAGVSGEVKYVSETNVLTIKNSMIKPEDNTPSIVVGQPLTIYAENAYCENDSNNAIEIKANTTIKSLQFDVKGNDYGILIDNGATLTFDHAFCEIDGDKAICGVSGEEKLVVEGGRLRLTSQDAVVSNLADLSIEDAVILEPEGSQWSAEKKAVVNNDEVVEGYLLIRIPFTGSRFYAFNSYNSSWIGFNLESPLEIQQYGQNPNGVFAGEFYNGNIYFYESETQAFYRMRFNGEAMDSKTLVGEMSTTPLVDMALDITTGEMYGLVNYSNIIELVKININDASVTTVADLTPLVPRVLAIDNDGVGYIIAGGDFTYNFYRVNLTNGSYELIYHDDSIDDIAYIQSMTCDHNTNEIYWAKEGKDAGEMFYYIDKTTGRPVPIANVAGGAEMSGLFTLTNWEGVEEMEAETQVVDKVKIYPNPCVDVLNIKSENTIQRVEIYNLLGEKVLDVVVGSEQMSLSTEELLSGVYVVDVTTAKGVVTDRIIVR